MGQRLPVTLDGTDGAAAAATASNPTGGTAQLVLTFSAVCRTVRADVPKGYHIELPLTVQDRVHALSPPVGLEGCMLAAALVAHWAAKEVLIAQHLHQQRCFLMSGCSRWSLACLQLHDQGPSRQLLLLLFKTAVREAATHQRVVDEDPLIV